MNDELLIKLLTRYVSNPEDGDVNFRIGLYYTSIGQTASAFSFFLRAAERTNDNLLRYECLLKAAECLESQGNRSFSVRGLLQRAIAICPNRPEGYYKLARVHEQMNKEGDMFECYMLASVGLSLININHPPLRSQVYYPGKYALLFEKAVSSWWCGLCDESRNIFSDLLQNYNMDEVHKKSVISNLINIGKLSEKEKELLRAME